MPTYFTDFSEYATGSGCPDITTSTNGPASGEIEESAHAGVTGGKILKLNSHSAFWTVPTYDNVNAEMVLKWRETGSSSFNGGAGGGPCVWPRFHQTSNPASTYIVGFLGAGGEGSNNWTVGKMVGNWPNYTSYSSISPLFDINNVDWWWARVRLHDGTLSWKAWEDTDDEPGSWDVSVSVSGVTESTNWRFGASDGSSNTRRMDVDILGFATNGDTAPTTGGGGGGGDNAIFFGCNFRRSHSILVPDMRLIHPRKRIILPSEVEL
jgi:hypothetical protein